MARVMLLFALPALLALGDDAARPALKIEPAGLKAPKYACLRFGEKVPRFVWLIWDGDSVHVDRDADGVLVPRERVQGSRDEGRPGFILESLKFDVGTLGPWTGPVSLSISRYDPAHKPADAPVLRTFAEALRNTPEPHVAYVRFTDSKGTYRRLAMTQFRAERADAPVIHVDGPLSLGPVEALGGQTLWLGEDNDFQVSLGTPGVGAGSFSFAMYDEFPERARPTAVIRFPGRDEPVTFKLLDKC